MRALLKAGLPVIGTLLAAGWASANTISFTADSVLSGNNNNNAVSGHAVFTTGDGTITVQITDTTSVIYDAVAAIRSVQFDVTSGQTSGSLSSSSGVARTIAGDGSYTDAAPATTTWALSAVGGDFLLSTANPASKELVINDPSGSVYTGDGSVNGNNGHNPFLANSPTFTLSVPGVNVDSSITNVVFGFGTGTLTLDGSKDPTPPTVPVPAASYGGLALVAAIGAFRVFRTRRQPA